MSSACKRLDVLPLPKYVSTLWTPAAAHQVSFFSCAKMSAGSRASFTSTRARDGVGAAVGARVGVATGIAEAAPAERAGVVTGVGVGVAVGGGEGVTGGSVTRTIGGVERSGTGPERKRSTLATARSY